MEELFRRSFVQKGKLKKMCVVREPKGELTCHDDEVVKAVAGFFSVVRTVDPKMRYESPSQNS